MAVEDDDLVSGRGNLSGGLTPADAIAAALASGTGKSDQSISDDTRAYLREQTELVRLQKENLRDQNEFEVSHLKWRRFNDRMKGALQILGFVVGFAFVAGVAALLWSAHDARGLVITPIRTPPDFADKGLDGTTLAQRLLDKLNGLAATSNGFSFRSPDTIQGSWGDDSKVEIPNTGISISELSRSLRLWLGHETHISGEVWRSSGGITLSVRAGTNPGVTFAGRDDDLDNLLDRAAEKILAQTQPYTYASLLASRGQWAATMKVARQIAFAGPSTERPWGFSILAGYGDFTGQTREAAAYGDQGVALAPDNPFVYVSRAVALYYLGAFERAVVDEDKTRKLFAAGGQVYGTLPTATAAMNATADELIGEMTGDFASAKRSAQDMGRSGWTVISETADLPAAAMAARDHDLALSRAISASHPGWDDAFALREGLSQGFYPSEFFRDIDVQNWGAAAADLDAADRTIRNDRVFNDFRRSYVVPWLAYALAMGGRSADAQAEIATCSLDSYPCLEMHGRVAEAGGKFAMAADWFARANRPGPSIPFADTDWGAMLLHRGDLDGAIEKFASANKTSPHYADPLELWGEALMQENRSDLARAKFEEADKYAPNWGRLHLEWGKALWWSGDKQGAERQFAIASGLGLSTADRQALQASNAIR